MPIFKIVFCLCFSRISFLATNLQTMFASENQFHNENAKVYNQFTDVVENLAMENQKGKYRIRKPGSPLILKGQVHMSRLLSNIN